jgi:predicted dehydrogenase
MCSRALLVLASLFPFAVCAPPSCAEDKPLRAGIIGCDTSHVIAFTDAINDPKATGALAQVEVTVAYPGGSPDLPDSANRLDAYVKQLRAKGLKIVDSLDELVDQCDAILLESVDGRPHLEQFRAVAKGKPVFVDKPTAASLADVISIFRVAKETNTPVFSSSSLRFGDEVRAALADKSVGQILGCETAGPMSIQKFHPDLFHYGIHGVEPLFTIMGTGCESVSRTDSPLSTVVVGKWNDGRLGSYRGLRKGHGYSFSIYGENAIVQRTGFGGYGPALKAICEFFINKQPPVTAEETIEVYAFMEAADESKRQGGKSVALADVIDRATQAADK